MSWKTILTVALMGWIVAVQAQPPTLPPAPPPAKPITEDGGQPVGNNQNSRTAGENGPATLDNFYLLQKLARFDRERIPERVVHARGTGVQGEFECTTDQSAFTKAKLFSAAGKKTPVFVRLSIVIPPSGAPEQLRDPRGFAIKFYTEEGNWDLVGNDLPVFFIRDSIKFPDLIHSLKPSPITNLQDPNRYFDFFSLVPESTHMLTFLYSDQGTPTNYRQIDGFGVHAFKWVNAKGEVTYVKFNWRSNQGLKFNTAAEVKVAAGDNPSGFTQDLYGNITAGKFPSWDLNVQMLSPADLDKFDFNPLDATKIWTGVPEVKVGRMTLNKIPPNFFQFTEQSAFSPGMLVPGIEASEDRLLQGRLFSYSDTQRYRVGTNYLDLPVNRPLAPVSNTNQDGKMNANVTPIDVNYEPSNSTGKRDNPPYEYSKAPLSGTVVQQPIQKTLNFKQAGELYRSFSPGERDSLVKNLTLDLSEVKSVEVKTRMVSHFYQADKEFGTRLATGLNIDLAEVTKLIEPTPAKSTR